MEENNEHYLQELRQRINAKAEEMVKINYSGGRKASKTTLWIAVAVFIAIFVGLEVLIYNGNNFWEDNALMGIFLIVGFIGHYLMILIMRHFLTSMKNASTAPKHYRAVKQLILTHKLRFLIPFAIAWLVADLVMYRSDSEMFWFSVIACIACIIGAIIGAAGRNWHLDEDFRYDVEELGDLIHQESAD